MAGMTASMGFAAATYVLVVRRRQLAWGATCAESHEPLAGDDLIATSDLIATRAITIRASAEKVWPWRAWAFGLAVIRAGAFPRWSGAALMAGVVLVAASSALPALAQVASAGVRDLAFAGMGTSLLLAGRRRRLPRMQDSMIVRDEAVNADTVRV